MSSDSRAILETEPVLPQYILFDLCLSPCPPQHAGLTRSLRQIQHGQTLNMAQIPFNLINVNPISAFDRLDMPCPSETAASGDNDTPFAPILQLDPSYFSTTGPFVDQHALQTGARYVPLLLCTLLPSSRPNPSQKQRWSETGEFRGWRKT